ncbi:MAG: DUF6029 family protein [Bacteroidia bacterium]|jgi:hypothetical protein
MKKVYLIVICIIGCWVQASAQSDQPATEEKGQLSGNFQTNNQFYLRDDRIGANTTQYMYQKSSTEAWLFLNYKIKGFNMAFRFDAFNNTPLFNPQQAYTKSGMGFWQVSKDIQKLNITVGYFYEQFGSGMSFRAYEDRNIGIDFAILGARVIYYPSENTQVKAFTGQQKFRFDIRESVIKGINAEHRFTFSDKFSNDLGGSIVNRTIDNVSMATIVSSINAYPLNERFDPKFNAYLFQAYNTINYGKVSLMLEYNYKTPEAILDANNKLKNASGQIYYGSLSFSGTGLGVNAQFKRVEQFPFRTSPLEAQPPPNNATVIYLPSITRQNTYRLLARYNSVIQELGENAAQLEITWKPSKKVQININTSVVNTLGGFNPKSLNYTWDTTTRLYREIYVDFLHKVSKSFKYLIGVQNIGYNQTIYEAKPNAPYVEAITPFGEFTYKLTNTKSFRFEWQYLRTKQDLGSFVNGLLEFNMAPHWSFAAGDLLNFEHGPLNKPEVGRTFEYVHYFNFYAGYTYNTTRVTAGFLKQPQGVNCTGGICRVEPAFSGMRIGLVTNF